MVEKSHESLHVIPVNNEIEQIYRDRQFFPTSHNLTPSFKPSASKAKENIADLEKDEPDEKPANPDLNQKQDLKLRNQSQPVTVKNYDTKLQ